MNRFCIYLLVTLLFVLPNGAMADNKTATPEERAQKAIDACWAISLEDRSSENTNRQRRGGLNSGLCMEEHIIELSEKYLFPDYPDIVEATKDNLKKLRFGYGGIYWDLYNSLGACKSFFGCGTMYNTFHNLAYAELLEDIILDVYKQIERYDINPKD